MKLPDKLIFVDNKSTVLSDGRTFMCDCVNRDMTNAVQLRYNTQPQLLEALKALLDESVQIAAENMVKIPHAILEKCDKAIAAAEAK